MKKIMVQLDDGRFMMPVDEEMEKGKQMPVGATATWADGKTYKKVSETKWEQVGEKSPSTQEHHALHGGDSNSHPAGGQLTPSILHEKFRTAIEGMDKEERSIYRNGKMDFWNRTFTANDGFHALKFEGGKVIKMKVMKKAGEEDLSKAKYIKRIANPSGKGFRYFYPKPERQSNAKKEEPEKKPETFSSEPKEIDKKDFPETIKTDISNKNYTYDEKNGPKMIKRVIDKKDIKSGFEILGEKFFVVKSKYGKGWDVLESKTGLRAKSGDTIQGAITSSVETLKKVGREKLKETIDKYVDPTQGAEEEIKKEEPKREEPKKEMPKKRYINEGNETEHIEKVKPVILKEKKSSEMSKQSKGSRDKTLNDFSKLVGQKRQFYSQEIYDEGVFSDGKMAVTDKEFSQELLNEVKSKIYQKGLRNSFFNGENPPNTQRVIPQESVIEKDPMKIIGYNTENKNMNVVFGESEKGEKVAFQSNYFDLFTKRYGDKVNFHFTGSQSSPIVAKVDNKIVGVIMPVMKKKYSKVTPFDIKESMAKAISDLSEVLAKGKKAGIGEIRDYNGKKFRKVESGKWVPVKEGGNKSGGKEEVPGEKNKKTEQKKGEKFSPEKKSAIKTAIKNLISTLADTLSGKDSVPSAARTGEQAGEDISSIGKGTKSKKEIANKTQPDKKKQ